MVVLIDNYDSFTYNLADYFNQLGYSCHIVKNDMVTIPDIVALAPKCLVVSPGPGTPAEAGISLQAIDYFAGRLPILGVCLGHQAIASHFGAQIIPASKPMHGKQDCLHHDNKGMFESLPNPMSVVRYHSLVVDRSTLPAYLTLSAESEDGTIMGIRHTSLPIEGVQFHPEAILTVHGMALLRQFFQCYLPVREFV